MAGAMDLGLDQSLEIGDDADKIVSGRKTHWAELQHNCSICCLITCTELGFHHFNKDPKCFIIT